MEGKGIWSMLKGIIVRTFAAAVVGAMALAMFAGTASAQAVPDSLVSGTITGAATGATVSVSEASGACRTVAGGTVAVGGAYQIVVNCASGPATLLVDGATVTTFTLTAGTPVTVNGTIGATTPTATATATTPASTATVKPPTTGNSLPAGSSSSAWMFIIAGLGALALGIGGVTALRKAR